MAKRREQPRKASISYAERKQREAERNLAKSRAGRDIGLPPSPDDVDRRDHCAGSFRAFCETYFPSAFCLRWSEDHLRVMAKIERAVLHGGLFAFAMPRGSGKTTLARVAGMWAVLYGHREYVCLIGSAEDQAKNILEAIKRDLLANDLLLADFPEAIYPIRKLENNARRQIGQLCNGEPTYITWSADRLVMPTMPNSPSSGGIVTVAGLDSNIRGQQHTKMDGSIVRPSLVILDDPQTRQSAASATQTRHRLAILNGDVLGMGGPGVKMAGFMTCTKIYHDDLADQILDRERNPDWQGECTKMVYAFPSGGEAERLWDRYAQVRADSLRADGDGAEATEFYRQNRDAMDAGAVVAWPDRYNDDEISALQHAVNLKLRDEEAFLAEYQNEPLSEQAEDEILTPDQVADRFNGRPRKVVPAAATHLTAFIDVHDRLLYYVVAAWEQGFTGYVVDYGTWPDQKRMHFTMRDAKKTLGDLLPGAGVEGAVQSGLEGLATDLLTREWQQNEGATRIDRLLIDSGYLPGVVANVWTPWFVIDPEAFGSFKVKTDDTDDTPGYLDDELQVGENPGQPHTWIRKRVNDEPAPGSDPDANDHKLRLYHGDWNAANTNKTGNLMSLGAPGANVQVVDGAVAPGPGTAWFTFTEYEDEYDDKKHSKVKAKAGAKKLVIDGIGKVFTDANDTTPGFLDDEIIVTPQSGHAWLKKSVEPGGAADNKLLLEHNTQGPKDSEIDPIAAVAVVDVEGTPTLRITARKSGHDARGHHTGDAGNQDHDVVVADEKVKSWEEDPNAGYLLDKIEGDGFWIVKSLQDNRIVLEHGPPQWEDPNYTVVFEGDPHIEVLEGSAGFGDPKIPVDANGHITSNLGIQVTHKYPQDEDWTLDPVMSLSLNGTSLRITSKPASVDNKGHMRQGGASEQYHDLAMEAVTVVTAFRVEGTDLQVKTRTIYVPKADAESDWTTVHTGTECPSSGGS